MGLILFGVAMAACAARDDRGGRVAQRKRAHASPAGQHGARCAHILEYLVDTLFIDDAHPVGRHSQFHIALFSFHPKSGLKSRCPTLEQAP
mgnify:CR=1 FL=1